MFGQRQGGTAFFLGGLTLWEHTAWEFYDEGIVSRFFVILRHLGGLGWNLTFPWLLASCSATHSRLGHECYRDACQQVFLSQSYYMRIGNFRYCHWETSLKCVEAHFISILLQVRLYLGRFLWKGEKPLYYSAIDRPVVYKRRGEWGFFSLTPSNSPATEKLSVFNWKVNA